MKLPRSVLRVLSGRYLIAFGVALAVMIAGVVAVNEVISSKVAGVQRVKVNVAPAPAQGANYLILGCATPRAARPGPGTCSDVNGSQSLQDRVNSDTMMVVHVEPNQKRLLIVSFPRDLWVNIPGIGMAKIDAALGAGANTTIQTLQDDFGIPINHYVLGRLLGLRGGRERDRDRPRVLPVPSAGPGERARGAGRLHPAQRQPGPRVPRGRGPWSSTAPSRSSGSWPTRPPTSVALPASSSSSANWPASR